MRVKVEERQRLSEMSEGEGKDLCVCAHILEVLERKTGNRCACGKALGAE